MPAPEEHTTGYTVRTARTTDVDDITEVVVSVFDQTPIYPYRFPGAKEYPEDYARHTRLHQSVYLANVDSGAYAGWVAEVPVKRNRSKVIAYSYWQMADFDSRPPPKSGPTNTKRRDADSARVEAFNVAVKKARRDWFDSRFGDQYHYLISMAVHPDYQRRGIATAMVNLGLARANKQRIPVALIASPMGAKLYKSLGFVQVGTHYAQAENDNETMEIPGMLYHGP